MIFSHISDGRHFISPVIQSCNCKNHEYVYLEKIFLKQLFPKISNKFNKQYLTVRIIIYLKMTYDAEKIC